jgi:hypothetical protein
MSLLSIIQGATLRCNVGVPTQCIGNPDPTIQQFIAWAQDAGDELAERWYWLNLKRPNALASPMGQPAEIIGDGTTTIFPAPAGWGRFSPSDIVTSSIYPTLTLAGPVNEGDLLRLKQLPFTPLPSVWRLIGDPSNATYIEFWPAPASGEILSFTYGSYQWITNSAGVPYASSLWTADTDISLIADRLIRLGTIWRWKKGKGLSYAEEFAALERSFDRRAGQESQVRTIRMSVEPLRGEDWFPGTITDLTTHIGEGT